MLIMNEWMSDDGGGGRGCKGESNEWWRVDGGSGDDDLRPVSWLFFVDDPIE